MHQGRSFPSQICSLLFVPDSAICGLTCLHIYLSVTTEEKRIKSLNATVNVVMSALNVYSIFLISFEKGVYAGQACTFTNLSRNLVSYKILTNNGHIELLA